VSIDRAHRIGCLDSTTTYHEKNCLKVVYSKYWWPTTCGTFCALSIDTWHHNCKWKHIHLHQKTIISFTTKKCQLTNNNLLVTWLQHQSCDPAATSSHPINFLRFVSYDYECRNFQSKSVESIEFSCWCLLACVPAPTGAGGRLTFFILSFSRQRFLESWG